MWRWTIAATLSSLTACAGLNQPTEQVAAAPTRDLTSLEKAALAPQLSRNLKDPTSAQFRWMPVVLVDRPDGLTDYCGMINGRNSYGGYTGYTRFYAQLKKDGKAQFTQAETRAIEEPNREINPLDPRWLNGICEKFGYADFSRAN